MNFKSWHSCECCLDAAHPHATEEWKKKNWMGNTLMIGDCPDCGAKRVTLVPLGDYRERPSPEEWD